MASQQQQAHQQQQRFGGATIGVACLACRDRHVKCDAAQPQCARCVKGGQTCVYVASRRGHRPTRPIAVDLANGTSTTTPPRSVSPGQSSASNHAHQLGGHPHKEYTAAQNNGANVTPPRSSGSEHSGESQPQALSHDQRHIDLYYEHFHPGHPFLLPQRFSNLRPWPTYLRDTILLVGSQFCDQKHAFDCGRSIDMELDALPDRTIDRVQAWLLRAIFLHASARARCAAQQLDKAVSLARAIGLDHEWFAASQVSPMLAESARRTWWELFTIDGMFAGFHHKTAFQTNEVPGDTMLPCDELAYENGFPPKPTLTYRHLRRRVLMDDHTITSYALRIEAVGILGRVLAVNDPTAQSSSESLGALDGLLQTWTSSLPDGKTSPVRLDGRCDELLFQAQMIALMANVYLHLPRSGIFSFRSATDVACARANEQALAFLNLDLHAARAMNSANCLATLASLDNGTANGRSPFFICALVLVAIVHLSSMAIYLDQSPEWHMDRLSQIFGLLRSASRYWRLAANVHVQLKTVATTAADIHMDHAMSCAEPSAVGDFGALMSDMWWADAICYNWSHPETMQAPDLSGYSPM
ncbi:hypothetical protein ANO11243_093640 [Dothideomycetidae sp. 11243]|nr:hypothetical protein ANO11243_093640 [fungal sp. No.11243]